jgi:hypothetical protein
MTTGDRDARGDARALGTDRFLGDLDDDFLALVEDRIDPRRRRPATTSAAVATSAATRLAFGVTGFESALEVVTHVEKGCFLQADVDESGLHAGEHAHDASLDDVADDALVAFALDMQLSELALLEQRNPGFPEFRVDDDLVLHRSACSASGSSRLQADVSERSATAGESNRRFPGAMQMTHEHAP